MSKVMSYAEYVSECYDTNTAAHDVLTNIVLACEADTSYGVPDDGPRFNPLDVEPLYGSDGDVKAFDVLITTGGPGVRATVFPCMVAVTYREAGCEPGAACDFTSAVWYALGGV
jgi:hypothetical protein